MTIHSTKIMVSEKNLIHNMDYLSSNFGKKISGSGKIQCLRA